MSSSRVSSLIVGVFFLIIALNAGNWIHGQLTLEFIPGSLLAAPWDKRLIFGSMYPGLFLLGAVPTYLYLRWNLITPSLVVLLPFLITLWFESQRASAQSDLITPYGIYLIAWFIVLVGVLVAAAGEWGVKRALIDGSVNEQPH